MLTMIISKKGISIKPTESMNEATFLRNRGETMLVSESGDFPSKRVHHTLHVAQWRPEAHSGNV